MTNIPPASTGRGGWPSSLQRLPGTGYNLTIRFSFHRVIVLIYFRSRTGTRTGIRTGLVPDPGLDSDPVPDPGQNKTFLTKSKKSNYLKCWTIILQSNYHKVLTLFNISELENCTIFNLNYLCHRVKFSLTKNFIPDQNWDSKKFLKIRVRILQIIPDPTGSGSDPLSHYTVWRREKCICSLSSSSSKAS